MAKPLTLMLAGLAVVAALSAAPAAAATDFEAWLDKLRQEARAQGISAATVDTALANVKPIPRVIELDRRQPEFTLTFAQYMLSLIHI